MKKVALIISGAGYLDGAEIRETVLTLLELERLNAETMIFAPNRDQYEVINHFNNTKMDEKRNMLFEAARIAHGKVLPLDDLNPNEFDALIMPGGFGVARNFTTFALENNNATISKDIEEVVTKFVDLRKPIGLICLSPLIAAFVFKDKSQVKLTFGNEYDHLNEMGIKSIKCNTDNIVTDEMNKLVSTPAYLHDDKITDVHTGITKLVNKVLEMA